MDIFQNICIAIMGLALAFALWKIYAMSIAISGLREFFEEYSEENAEAHGAFQRVADDVEKLKNGIVPDFEAARQAATATNDFFQGVSNIMAFDPYKALHKDEDGEKT